MPDDEEKPDILGMFAAVQESWRLQLDGMEGMVTEARSRGWTEAQARALVAFQFGWRPPADPA